MIPLVVVEETGSFEKSRRGRKRPMPEKSFAVWNQLRHQGDLLKGVRIGQEEVDRKTLYICGNCQREQDDKQIIVFFGVCWDA